MKYPAMWKVIHRTNKERKQKYQQYEKYVVYNRIDKSAVTEHINKNKEHNINFNSIKILNKEQNYGEEMIKETIEIKNVQPTSIEKTVGK